MMGCSVFHLTSWQAFAAVCLLTRVAGRFAPDSKSTREVRLPFVPPHVVKAAAWQISLASTSSGRPKQLYG